MLEILPDTPGNVVAVSATGQVIRRDYDEVLIPAVEQAAQAHERVRILYHLGPYFVGFSAGAMWDDARLGVRHLRAFERIAVVTDTEWVVNSVKAFAFVIPCPVKIFPDASLEEALAWIAEPDAEAEAEASEGGGNA